MQSAFESYVVWSVKVGGNSAAATTLGSRWADFPTRPRRSAAAAVGRAPRTSLCVWWRPTTATAKPGDSSRLLERAGRATSTASTPTSPSTSPSISWNDVDDKVADMVKQDHAPDIAQLGSYADYAASGQLYTADELLTITEQADFIPSLAQAGKVDRAQYGMPLVASSRMFFYNRSLFEKAGITRQRPPPGANWRRRQRLKATASRSPTDCRSARRSRRPSP